jgi:hypothetical protein
MSSQAPSRTPGPRLATNDKRVRNVTNKCTCGINRELAPLTTANRNRVLLALHWHIAEQLETLNIVTTE